MRRRLRSLLAGAAELALAEDMVEEARAAEAAVALREEEQAAAAEAEVEATAAPEGASAGGARSSSMRAARPSWLQRKRRRECRSVVSIKV